MSSFQRFQFGDIFDVASGLSKPREDFGFGHPFVSYRDIYHNYFLEDELEELANTTPLERDRCSVKRGDIFLTRTSETVDELGMSCVSLKDYPNATFNGFAKRLRLKDDTIKVHPEFIAYYLRSHYFRQQVDSMAVMTTRASLNNEMISRLFVDLPSLPEQIKIAYILKSLDDKIKVNKKINETLESMAKAVFKEWFIDFGPVKAKAEGKKPFGMDDETASLFPDRFEDSELGQIPKGWDVKTIDDVCIFQNGYAFKSNLMTTDSNEAKRIFKMGNIVKGGGFNADGSDDYYPNAEIQELDRYLAKKGDLLMCMTDMKNNVALLGNTALMPVSDEYLVNQRVGLLRSKKSDTVNYPFLFLLTNEPVFLEDLRSRANSGVQVNLSTDEIKKSKLTLPKREIHQAFDKRVLPFFEKIEMNRKESEYLKTTRDLLLPKLVSGEIELKGADV